MSELGFPSIREFKYNSILDVIHAISNPMAIPLVASV